MNFLRKHPFLFVLTIIAVIAFILMAITTIVGSQRIDRAPETTTGEDGYVRPLWQD